MMAPCMLIELRVPGTFENEHCFKHNNIKGLASLLVILEIDRYRKIAQTNRGLYRLGQKTASNPLFLDGWHLKSR